MSFLIDDKNQIKNPKDINQTYKRPFIDKFYLNLQLAYLIIFASFIIYISINNYFLNFPWLTLGLVLLFGFSIFNTVNSCKKVLRVRTNQSIVNHYIDVTSNLPGYVYQFYRTPEGQYGMNFLTERVKDFFDVTPEEAIKDVNLLFQRVIPEDLPCLLASIEKSAENFCHWGHDFRCILPDGSISWFRGSSNPRRNSDGGIIWNGVLININKEKESELERFNLERILKDSQRLESIGRLSAEMAHEFNNYLQIIETNLQMIFDQNVQSESFNRALLACKKGQQLNQQILKYSQGKKVEKTNLDLSTTISDVICMLRSLLPKNIQLESQIQPELFTFGNPIQIQQVLLNLVNNASKAIEHNNGIIKIKLNLSDTNDEMCALVVEDNGCGMTDEDIQLMFEPFFTTKSERGGTGLGLSIVRSIVESHNGLIKVESHKNIGTKINTLFPLNLNAKTSINENEFSKKDLLV